jgi:endonuclease-3
VSGSSVANTDEAGIQQILASRGLELFSRPRRFIEFARNPQADALTNDIENTPHAFLLGCLVDRQMNSDFAWLVPFRLAEKLGDFRFCTLSALTLDQITDLMTQPEPLHRFPVKMATNIHLAIKQLRDEYEGDASRIWAGSPSSATVVYRFLGFRGIGPKIATMAANILARDFKVPLSDHFSIDVSPDVHLRRVFTRLGLIPVQPTNEQLVYRARALHPEFPGLLDLPAWEIGREWCRPRDPNCSACYMREVCSYARSQISAV